MTLIGITDASERARVAIAKIDLTWLVFHAMDREDGILRHCHLNACGNRCAAGGIGYTRAAWIIGFYGPSGFFGQHNLDGIDRH
ncbi:hypothetical protein ASL20_19560 [Cupriavidus necator]|nr:hypothetical protein ASL20_19560 [Cupriavidus necator]